MKTPLLLILLLIAGLTAKAQTISVTFSPDTAMLGQQVTATVIVQGGQPLTTIDWYDFVGPQSALGDGNDTLEFTFIHVQPLMANRPVTITNGNTVLHDTLHVNYPGCMPCVYSDTPDTVLLGQPFVIRFWANALTSGVINWADGTPMGTGYDNSNIGYTFTHTYSATGVYNAFWMVDMDTFHTPIVVVDTTQVPLNIITPMGGEVFTANNTDTLVVSTAIFGPLYYYVLRANGDTLDQGQLQAVAVQGNLRKFLITWPNVLEPSAHLWVSMTQGTNIGIDTSNPFTIANRVINGSVFFDANQNNSIDLGDNPYNHSPITASQPNEIFMRDWQGNYSLSNLQPGIANLTLLNPPMGFTGSPSLLSVDVTNPGVYNGNNFALQTNGSGIYDLDVQIWRHENCSAINSNVQVWTFNRGQDFSPQTTLVYNFDPAQITVLTMLSSPGVLGSGTYTFTVPPAGPWQGSMFNVVTQLTVPVGTIINEGATTPIVDAHLYNNGGINTFYTVGAIDPNNIIPSPGIIYTPDNINPEPITYVVNFQNTGNAEAVNIRVNDTIAANLDMNTFEVLESSHNMNTIIRPGGVVDFMFPNIMLPDSNANEPASHGYVIYRIKPTGTIPVNTTVDAKVDIYFDYNEAVTTNTATTVVMEPLGVKENTKAQFSIYPNPTNGMVYIQPNTAYQNEKLSVRIFAADGRLVYTENYNAANGLKSINTANLPTGIYNLQLSNGKTQSSQKLVKN